MGLQHGASGPPDRTPPKGAEEETFAAPKLTCVSTSKSGKPCNQRALVRVLGELSQEWGVKIA